MYDPQKPSQTICFANGGIKVKYSGKNYSCVFVVRNSEEFGDWVVLKRFGEKPIDVFGLPATNILDDIEESINKEGCLL